MSLAIPELFLLQHAKISAMNNVFYIACASIYFLGIHRCTLLTTLADLLWRCLVVKQMTMYVTIKSWSQKYPNSADMFLCTHQRPWRRQTGQLNKQLPVHTLRQALVAQENVALKLQVKRLSMMISKHKANRKQIQKSKSLLNSKKKAPGLLEKRK